MSRKVPGRETGRWKRNRTVFDENSQSSKVREGSGKAYQKPAIQEGPGRFREHFREGVTCTTSSVSIRFLNDVASSYQKPPDRNPHIDSVSSDRFWSRFWTCQKPAIQEGPGRFREGFREANNIVNSQVKEYLTAVIYIYIYYIYIYIYMSSLKVSVIFVPSSVTVALHLPMLELSALTPPLW